MKIGVVYGTFTRLLKISIFYGGFVEVVYQHVVDFKKGAYRVLHHVPFVIMELKMICMCCFIVNLVPKVEVVQVWINLSLHICGITGICVMLFLVSAPRLINTLQVYLLLSFGCCGIIVIIAFGITQRSKEEV
jgi:hypothetical protein